MAAELETWRNATKGMVYLLKIDRFGNETHEVVNGGKSFSLSNAERLLNQDRAANEGLDMFKNGQLVPVRLLEGDEEAAEIAANPNLMGEQEMTELFKTHWKTFDAKLAKISNLVTLSRMMEVANEVDATIKQVAMIEARIGELSPQAKEVSEEAITAGSDNYGEAITGRAVTPK